LKFQNAENVPVSLPVRAAGREIDRSQYADAAVKNNKRYHANAQLYRKRQEINEHIFGTKTMGLQPHQFNGTRKK
jgi:hypothetical protein